jgi:hypothetical protein
MKIFPKIGVFLIEITKKQFGEKYIARKINLKM